MIFRIPNSFKIGGELFTVSIVKSCTEQTSETHGQATYSKGRIEVRNDPETTPEYKRFVFLHEFVHVLLYAIEEDKLRSNEEFCSRLARAMHQAFETMDYSDQDCELAPGDIVRMKEGKVLK